MDLRNMTLYSIFVRNFGGSFEAVRQEVPRLRALGVDAVWLLPIHPIGKAQRKGTLGSPYAISDYRAVNPEYGALADFQRLADALHENGMKLLIDVVYNHTSPDSWLAQHHPEWFYHRPDGSFGNRIGDWYDVIDLDYSQPGLWDYQIDTLKMWAKIVDGFRCDVAPLVPLDFWKRARQEVEAVRPGCIWLAESVEPEFIRACRHRGMTALSDSEIYQAFQACYDYDVYGDFLRYVRGEAPLSAYIAALERQESAYPADYVKLRFLENHDRPRMAFLFPEERLQRNWLAWLFFQKGLTLLYSGQEGAPVHRPSLFDPDPVALSPAPVHGPLLQTLAAMKKDPLFSQGIYTLSPGPNDLLMAQWRMAAGRRAVGLFSLKGKKGLVPTDLPDGTYPNLLDSAPARVEGGLLASQGEPVILMLNK